MLLANNSDIVRRLASLESRYPDRNSVATERPSSPMSTATVTQVTRHTSVEYEPTILVEALTPSSSLTQYESELEASRVYRNVRRQSDDVTFRSSIARSHAWSALSHVSLSAISALSVIALPLYPSEITNAYHYLPADPGIRLEISEVSGEPAASNWPSSGDENAYTSNINDTSPRSSQVEFRSISSSSGPVPPKQAWARPSTDLRLVVIGASGAGEFSLVAKV